MHRSSDNRQLDDLNQSPTKGVSDYPMSLKPHLKTRFVRDKPVKPNQTVAA